MSMNREVKEKWVAALRSGKYVQGENALFSEGKYCCLGVLYEVMQIPYQYYLHSHTKEYYFNQQETNEFGDELELEGKWYSTSSNSIIPDNLYDNLYDISEKEIQKLIIMNDGQSQTGSDEPVSRHSFEQIANYIEVTL